MIIICFLFLISSVVADPEVLEKKNETKIEFSFGFQSNVDYLYHYATDVHMDNKIWHGIEESRIRRNADAAFHLYARLNLTSVWRSTDGKKHLLKLQLSDPRFINRTNSHSMIDCLALSGLSQYPGLFIWDDGIISSAYFNENDQVAAINLKKGIMSLFQYKQNNRSETDTLGRCDTEYRIYEDRLIKDKFHCSNVRYSDEFASAKETLNYTIDLQATCSYKFDNSTLKMASCSDTAFPRLVVPEIAGFRVISRTNVDLIEKVDNEKHQIYTSSDAALKSILKLTPDQFHTLETEKQTHPCDDYCARFDDFIRDHQNELNRKTVGSRAASNVFLHLISLVRRQSEQTLFNTLDKAQANIRFTLIEAFLAAQTPHALNAVFKHVDNALTGKNKIQVAEQLLLAGAFAPRATDLLLEKLFDRLPKIIAMDATLEQSGYLALGAVVHKLFESNPKSSMIEKYSTLLQNTKKKSLVFLSIYNAKADLYQPIIVDEIRRCNDTNLCWLALNALTQYDAEKFSKEIVDILRSIYHEQAGRVKTNLQIRQICGELLLRTDISIGDLTNLLFSALDKSNHQLGSFMWKLIETKSKHNLHLARKIRYIFDGGLVDLTYDSITYRGQSDYYRRPLVETFGYGVYYTISQLMSRLGALRESDFHLDLQRYDKKDSMNLLSFGVSASGLDAYVSNDGKSSDTPDENLQAELRIHLFNMQLRPVVLFQGVTGLMSAVWSAPSELTSAFKSNIMIHDLSRYVHLHNGLIIHYEAQSAASLDLSGMASVSLWNKNSHSVIEVSSGLSVRSHVDLLSDFVVLGINLTVSTDVVVDYITDVDYADTPIKVCMQMEVKPMDLHEHIDNFYSLRRTKAFRWSGNRTRHYSGQDFTFTGKNDAMCRQLHMD